MTGPAKPTLGVGYYKSNEARRLVVPERYAVKVAHINGENEVLGAGYDGVLPDGSLIVSVMTAPADPLEVKNG